MKINTKSTFPQITLSQSVKKTEKESIKVVKSAVVIERLRRQRNQTTFTVDGQPCFTLELNCSDEERTDILSIIARAGKAIIVDPALPSEKRDSRIITSLNFLIAKKHSPSKFQLKLLP